MRVYKYYRANIIAINYAERAKKPKSHSTFCTGVAHESLQPYMGPESITNRTGTGKYRRRPYRTSPNDRPTPTIAYHRNSSVIELIRFARRRDFAQETPPAGWNWPCPLKIHNSPNDLLLLILFMTVVALQRVVYSKLKEYFVAIERILVFNRHFFISKWNNMKQFSFAYLAEPLKPLRFRGTRFGNRCSKVCVRTRRS